MFSFGNNFYAQLGYDFRIPNYKENQVKQPILWQMTHYRYCESPACCTYVWQTYYLPTSLLTGWSFWEIVALWGMIWWRPYPIDTWQYLIMCRTVLFLFVSLLVIYCRVPAPAKNFRRYYCFLRIVFKCLHWNFAAPTHFACTEILPPPHFVCTQIFAPH